MWPGTRIDDRFVVEKFHAGGGMGKVFRARDELSSAVVALKVVPVAQPVDDARFAREVAMLARVQHPGVVGYVASGALGEHERYLVEEWIEGPSLATKLAEGLTVAECLTVARVIAEALGAAHACGVVHRDIKPSNVLLVGGRFDAARIIDFGIARLIDEKSRLTRTGTTVGTPGYMAPEQNLGHGDVDARADVFSLGCVVYSGLCGFPPFPGTDATAVRAKVLFHEPPPLPRRCPEAPAALIDLVGRMMAKSPDERPANGSEVAAALAAIDPPHASNVRRSRVLDATTQQMIPLETAPLAGGIESLVFVRALAGAIAKLDDVARAGGVTFTRLDAETAMTRLTGSPTDTACRAAGVALHVARTLPEVAAIVVSGSALDQLLDAGARALEQEALQRAVDRDAHARIWIDPMTAELVGAHHSIVSDARGHYMVVR